MKNETIFSTLSRRRFIRNAVFAASGATVLPSLLSGCDDDDKGGSFPPQGDYGFLHGVASFDPTEDKVILGELVSIKVRLLQGDPSLTAAELARLQTVLPYNLDAWDGYPVDQQKVFAAAAGKKLISMAGDTHNAWYTDMLDGSNTKVGTEFGGTSISSPGFEELFGNIPQLISGFEQAVPVLVDNVKYLDASRRGFIMVTFSNTQATADYRFVTTLATKDTTTTSGKLATIS